MLAEAGERSGQAEETEAMTMERTEGEQYHQPAAAVGMSKRARLESIHKESLAGNRWGQPLRAVVHSQPYPVRRAALRSSQPPPTSSSRVPGGRPNAAGRENTHASCQLCGVGVQHNHEQAASDWPGAARPRPPRHATGRPHPPPPLPPPPPPAPAAAGCCCCLLRFQFIPMYTVMAPAVSTMPATCRGWENGPG